MSDTTGSSNIVAIYRDGVLVYPCRCGQEHTGDYALEDWRHHNCFHEKALVVVGCEQALCGLCGASFVLRWED